jgi:hypothetical protein
VNAFIDFELALNEVEERFNPSGARDNQMEGAHNGREAAVIGLGAQRFSSESRKIPLWARDKRRQDERVGGGRAVAAALRDSVSDQDAGVPRAFTVQPFPLLIGIGLVDVFGVSHCARRWCAMT